jgi:hypothetical protein
MSRSKLLASLLALPLATSLALSLGLAGCGPSGSGDDDDGGPCTSGQTQCVGQQFQTCVDSSWETTENCAAICDPDSGCRTCTPGINACRGQDVVTCNPDGSFGTTVETCGDGTECSGGACQRACSADGVDLIYVADKNFQLLAFDPREIGPGRNPFRVIGPLNCAAGPSVPDWADPTATPFSMAVDRNAVAWVLYTSGEIFNVSTENAACSRSAFAPRQSAGGRTWDLFGMGFVTDTAGGDTEKLWLGGGNADAQILGDLGWISPPGSFNIQRVGAMTTASEYSPELTGLGDATLWGFYPGLSSAFVQQIDKTSGGPTGPQRTIPGGLGGTVAAWAFAQWGGKFYLFVTTTDALGLSENSTVRTIDRTTGQYQLVAQNLPYTIVGAGVSTCAPITIGRQLPWESMPARELPLDLSNLRP